MSLPTELDAPPEPGAYAARAMDEDTPADGETQDTSLQSLPVKNWTTPLRHDDSSPPMAAMLPRGASPNFTIGVASATPVATLQAPTHIFRCTQTVGLLRQFCNLGC